MYCSPYWWRAAPDLQEPEKGGGACLARDQRKHRGIRDTDSPLMGEGRPALACRILC